VSGVWGEETGKEKRGGDARKGKRMRPLTGNREVQKAPDQEKASGKE